MAKSVTTKWIYLIGFKRSKQKETQQHNKKIKKRNNCNGNKEIKRWVQLFAERRKEISFAVRETNETKIDGVHFSGCLVGRCVHRIRADGTKNISISSYWLDKEVFFVYIVAACPEMATCYAMHVCISSLKMRTGHDSQTLCSLEKFHFPSLQISCTHNVVHSAVQQRPEKKKCSSQVLGICMRVTSFISLHSHIYTTYASQKYTEQQSSVQS